MQEQETQALPRPEIRAVGAVYPRPLSPARRAHAALGVRRQAALLPGQELWQSSNRYAVQAFRAYVADAVRRGEVEVLGRGITEYPNRAYVVVRRIKRAPVRWPWYLLAALFLAGWLTAAVITAWMYRDVIAILCVALALVWLGINRIRHAGACVGLHCEGCRSK